MWTGAVLDQLSPKQRLPAMVLIVATVPGPDHIRAKNLILVEQVSDPLGQLEALEFLLIAADVIAQRFESGLVEASGKEPQDLPGHDGRIEGRCDRGVLPAPG